MVKVVMLGNLGNDPEERITKAGKTVVTFPLAVSRKRQGSESAAWFSCSVSGATAQYAKNYLRKGSRVLVIGELEVSSYVSQNGEKRCSLNVWVSDLQNVSSRQDSSEDGGSKVSSSSQSFASQPELDEDSDLPF